MRLSCPNCHARYAVSASMIPASGREVECSACGHVWVFVPEGPQERAGDDETADPAAPPRDTAPPVAQTQTAPPPVEDVAEDGDPVAGSDAEAPIPPAHERMDPSALGVLREEAARETSARAAERSAPQPPQAAAPPDGEGAAVTPGPAQPRAPYLATPQPREGDEAPRPERSSAEASLRRQVRERAAAEAETAPGPSRRGASRRGFAAGLGLVIALAVLGALLYAGSDEIAAAWPPAEAALAAYVDAIDGARLWIAARAEDSVTALVELIARLSG